MFVGDEGGLIQLLTLLRLEISRVVQIDLGIVNRHRLLMQLDILRDIQLYDIGWFLPANRCPGNFACNGEILHPLELDQRHPVDLEHRRRNYIVLVVASRVKATLRVLSCCLHRRLLRSHHIRWVAHRRELRHIWLQLPRAALDPQPVPVLDPSFS